ncbi:FtsB family cell division protein [Pseudoprimorskyibacter insulae]|uniref:Cell division protein FtsB n=1 Tax=Pseudoprimorskyibacter insulae TaxID=1695997 RepID=A0A2R8AXU4_9RHOB|nr:septum formation initiator family protein [Pseudoprimorskyibacter insulae]SPF80818.1 hypothetical protein PRI8871_02630 [Pseudoprimorskyibacter insulae]
MSKPSRKPAFSGLLFFAIVFSASVYFTFAAVQGNYGVFRRAEIELEAKKLRTELAELTAEAERMENLTRRLSDDYLDIDLLDQQARDILGAIRPDEIVVN